MKTIIITNDGDVTIYHYGNYDAIRQQNIFAYRIAALTLQNALIWIAKVKRLIK